MTIEVENLAAKFVAFRARWQERNDRMDSVAEAVAGKYRVNGPNDESVENRSPNFIQVGIKDTAEAASVVPTLRVDPVSMSTHDKDVADDMERMAVAYMDSSQFELLNIRELQDLVAYGLAVALVYRDNESGAPQIQWRDARTCYPEPGWRTLDSIKECFFARDIFISQLPQEWQALIEQRSSDRYGNDSSIYRFYDKKVIFVEYFCEDEWWVGCMYQDGSGLGRGAGTTYSPIEFMRGTTPGGLCSVVVGQSMELDNEPHGQFEQLIGMQKAHIRLQGLALDYADQAVYSDIWVKDLIGSMQVGGGGYIQLGPNGEIGRVPPAVTGFTVFQELQQLIDGMHLGGRYPKSRPGEIDQAIASAKFLETSAGVMNTAVRTYHLIMKRFWEQVLRVCFAIDKASGSKRTYSGVLRNQQFMIERDPSGIDLGARVRVEYGMALGHDPASAMVLGIQAQGAGFVSTEFVQENFEGITDVARERARIDVEQLRNVVLAQILEGLQAGSIPKSALVEIAKARADGKDLFEIFEKYVVKPMEEQQAQMLTSGLTGEQMAPGSPMEAPKQGPQAPPAEQLMAALAGGGEAAAPSPASRLNVPLGNGSFVSSNQGMG